MEQQPVSQVHLVLGSSWGPSSTLGVHIFDKTFAMDTLFVTSLIF